VSFQLNIAIAMPTVDNDRLWCDDGFVGRVSCASCKHEGQGRPHDKLTAASAKGSQSWG